MRLCRRGSKETHPATEIAVLRLGDKTECMVCRSVNPLNPAGQETVSKLLFHGQAGKRGGDGADGDDRYGRLNRRRRKRRGSRARTTVSAPNRFGRRGNHRGHGQSARGGLPGPETAGAPSASTMAVSLDGA